MREAIREDLVIQSLISLMFVVGLTPDLLVGWLVFLSLFIYMVGTYKVFITTKATGHHNHADGNTYICMKTGKELYLNEEEWNASGDEHSFGFFSSGFMRFTNSYRVPGWCKYVGIRLKVPRFFGVGIDFGLVRGYRGYYDNGQMKSGLPIGRTFLFFMVPAIRWRPAHKRGTFVCIRQFGSATVTSEGRVEE